MSLGIKKGDVVIVLSGEDKGKTGKIKEIMTKDGRAYVEGVNMCKKHQKLQRQGGESGIVEKEQPVDLSNLALYDGKSGKATRIRMGLSKEGKKVRVGVKSGTVFD
jgi:large subunit ribosomal protein L24